MLIQQYAVSKRRVSALWNAKIMQIVNLYFDSIIIQLGMLGVTVLSCTWYIVGTYTKYGQSNAIEIFFFCVFFFDYSMSVTAMQRKFDYIFSAIGFYDLMSMVPILSLTSSLDPKNMLPSSASWLGYLRFLRILNIFHLVRRRNSFRPTDPLKAASIAVDLSEVTYQIGILFVNILVFVLVSAGVIFSLTLFEEDAFSVPFDGAMTWFDSFYFTVVTATTVGYGDIAPNTNSAKFVSILIIIFGFSLIPAQVAALLTVLYQRPKYIGALAMPINSHHICICGIVDYELLYRLLTEIHHPTHAPATIGANIIVVVLSPMLPSKPVETLLSSFRSKVRFFVGSSKSPIDLYRIRAENALAIYILSDVRASSLRNEEDAVFISAVSVSRYLDSKVSENLQQLYTQNLISSASADSSRDECSRGNQNNKTAVGNLFDRVLRSRKVVGENHILNLRPRTMLKLASSARNRAVLANCGIDIVLSLQEFKYTLVAYGAVFPGFLSLFLNLNRSRTMPQQSKQNKWRQPDLFYEGTRFCVQQMATNNDIVCRRSLRTMSFHQAVTSLYRRSNGLVILVAIKEHDIVHINPSARKSCHRCIGDFEAIFLISPSWEVAWEIVSEEDNQCLISKIPLNNHWNNNEADIPDRHGCQTHIEDTFTAESVVADKALSLKPSSVQEIPDLSPEHTAHDHSSARGLNVTNSRALIAHHLKSCFAQTVRNSKVHKYDSYHVISLHDKTSNVSHTDHHKESIDQGIKSIGGRASYLKQLPHLRERFKDHVVLIMLSSSRSDALSANARLLPIIYFINAVRAQSYETIVVLCEDTRELSPAISQIDEANPRLLDGVFFLSGYARNPEHLKVCGVETARVITVIHHPRVAEVFEECLDTSSSRMVNADRHTIIISLSLQMILQQHQLKQQQYGGKNDEHLRPSLMRREPFIVYEVVHESNTVFLRDQKQGNIYGRSGQPSSTMQANSFDRDTNDVLLADDLFIADDVCVDYYDWPILAAGCVFSHTLLDALMVQAMYNSNIISFWEALTCTGDKGKCIVNDHQRNVTDGDILDDSCRDGRGKNYQRDSFIANSTKVGSEKTLRSSPISKSISHINQDVAEGGNPIEKGNIGIKIEWRNKGSTSAAHEQFNHEFPIHTEADFAVCHKSKESPSSPSSCDISSTGDRNGEVGEEKTEAGSTCPREDSCRSLLDKIVIPPIFVGKAFSVMFTSCFHYNGIIVIALYRLHNEEHSSATAERRSEKREYRSKANKRIVKTLLPFVVTAPPMNTILLSTDEIFILRASN